MAHDLVVPADFYISPSEAARLLNLSVRDIHLLQVEGKLTDVITTPGNHRRYNMREVLSLQTEDQGRPDNG
jgi:DNA-binding transcriptional MerR regulator